MSRTATVVLTGMAFAAVTLAYACGTKNASHETYEELGAATGGLANAPASRGERDALTDVRATGQPGRAYAPASFAAKAAAPAPSDRRLEPGQTLPPASYAGEELWVIARADDLEAQPAPPEPGTEYPALHAKPPGAAEEVPLPLKHTDVKASIAGYIASVRVTQRVPEPLRREDRGGLRLPAAAGRRGERVRHDHRRPAASAASSASARRPSASTTRPSARATSRRCSPRSARTSSRSRSPTSSRARRSTSSSNYFNPLAYHDGGYEFVFPMVVGPRFNPPGTSDGIGAVPRGQYGASGQATEVHYLAPGERSGHDIALAVDIDAGVPIEDLDSPTHAIETTAAVRQSAARRP